jgi:hypothetical protein
MIEAIAHAVTDDGKTIPAVRLCRDELGTVSSEVFDLRGSIPMCYELSVKLEGGRTHLVGIDRTGPPASVLDICEAILRCEVPAVFIPQAWVFQHAIEIDGGRVEFNAAPYLAQLCFQQIQELFARTSPDLDFLAERHGLTVGHSGPFDVICDYTDVVELVFLLNGVNVLQSDHHQISDITETMWSEFRWWVQNLAELTHQERAKKAALNEQIKVDMSATGVQDPDQAKKLIEIYLSALTRVEYMEVVEVPADISDAELQSLVNSRYDAVDGGDFVSDPEYWERASCHAVQTTMQGAVPVLRASRTGKGLHVEPVEAAAQHSDGGCPEEGGSTIDDCHRSDRPRA